MPCPPLREGMSPGAPKCMPLPLLPTRIEGNQEVLVIVHGGRCHRLLDGTRGKNGTDSGRRIERD